MFKGTARASHGMSSSMTSHQLQVYNLDIISGQAKQSSGQNHQAMTKSIHTIMQDTKESLVAIVSNFNLNSTAKVITCLHAGWNVEAATGHRRTVAVQTQHMVVNEMGHSR
jgi:hypothetical protein